MLLGVSLALFAATGFFEYSASELVILVAVLLFHEMGHYVGMRIFNYQDVRMFFIPFFGAAVAGRSTSVEGYKEAIVLFLGPLPGILVGLGIGIACFFYNSAILRSVAIMLLAVNGFNLLPFLPLDGGRLLDLILFSRQRHLEAVFRFVTGALLAMVGWLLGAWFLSIVGIFILLATRSTFRMSSLAQRLRGAVQSGTKMDLSARIPRELAVPLIERVREMFPHLVQPKSLANTVRQVWERMHTRPPGLAVSIVLLGVYGVSFLGTPLLGILFVFPIPSIATRTKPDGTTSRVLEMRSWGRLQATTELGADNQFNGRYVAYFVDTGKVAAEGSYVDGEPDGTWTYYTESGQFESQEVYHRGKLLEPTVAKP